MPRLLLKGLGDFLHGGCKISRHGHSDLGRLPVQGQPGGDIENEFGHENFRYSKLE